MSERRVINRPSDAYRLTGHFLGDAVNTRRLIHPAYSESALGEARKKIKDLQPKDPYKVDTMHPDGRLEFTVRLLKGIARDTDPQTRIAAKELLTLVPVAPEHSQTLYEQYLEAVNVAFQDPKANPHANIRDVLDAGKTLARYFPDDHAAREKLVKTCNAYGETLEDQKGWTEVSAGRVRALGEKAKEERKPLTQEEIQARDANIIRMRKADPPLSLQVIADLHDLSVKRVIEIADENENSSSTKPTMTEDQKEAVDAYLQLKQKRKDEGIRTKSSREESDHRRAMLIELQKQGFSRKQIAHILEVSLDNITYDLRVIDSHKDNHETTRQVEHDGPRPQEGEVLEFGAVTNHAKDEALQNDEVTEENEASSLSSSGVVFDDGERYSSLDEIDDKTNDHDYSR